MVMLLLMKTGRHMAIQLNASLGSTHTYTTVTSYHMLSQTEQCGAVREDLCLKMIRSP